MRKIPLCLLALFLGAVNVRAQSGPQPEIAAKDTQAREYEEIRDRLASSLKARGELADKIIDAGTAGEIVKLEPGSTYSDARLALLAWIKDYPENAARLALSIQNGAKISKDPIHFTISKWRINDGFLEKIKALSAASKDSRVSAETMELAAKRLYEGSIDETGEAAQAGGRAAGGSDFFSINYADYKLNRAGLQNELSGAGRVLDSMRGPSGKGPEGAEKPYAAAVARYGAFVVTASALKGRDVITGGESEALERGRTAMRAALAGLTLRGRAAALRAISGDLARERGRPGSAALAAAAAASGGRLEAAAARMEDGRLPAGDFSALVRGAEDEFADLYLKYSVYSGLLGLKKNSEALGFSCVYDYLFWRWLAAWCPDAPYVKARAAVAAAGAGLEAGLLKAGEGEIAGALEGPGGRAAELEAALAFARGASAANRAAQFFMWGVLFRPLEIEVSARGGKPFYQPALTFYSVIAPGGGRPGALSKVKR
ncbi:MAG TPA: hypothetical protein PKI19_02385 [Elusimicrobiales bacterium]|nr:hypothetical protein [Elusimicrobiales bacterium]